MLQYLKESNRKTLDITNMTNDYLAFLLDENMTYIISDPKFNENIDTYLDISFHFKNELEWGSISDYFLSYYEILTQRYKLYNDIRIALSYKSSMGVSTFYISEDELYSGIIVGKLELSEYIINRIGMSLKL